jgi:hypothetical protein
MTPAGGFSLCESHTSNFELAIEVARKKSARSWKLRATVSLAQLLAREDRGGEAYAMLIEIYKALT